MEITHDPAQVIDVGDEHPLPKATSDRYHSPHSFFGHLPIDLEILKWIGQRLFHDQELAGRREADDFGGQPSPVIENVDLFDRVQPVGISNIDLKTLTSSAKCQLLPKSAAWPKIKEFIHDLVFPIAKRLRFRSRSERHHLLRIKESLRIMPQSQPLNVYGRDFPFCCCVGISGCPNISRNRFAGCNCLSCCQEAARSSAVNGSASRSDFFICPVAADGRDPAGSEVEFELSLIVQAEATFSRYYQQYPSFKLETHARGGCWL